MQETTLGVKCVQGLLIKSLQDLMILHLVAAISEMLLLPSLEVC